ncbi:MAG: metalloregulator ArsR/SmtB family transcription factor [Planctomycetota bacterium]|nr:winged helix-turn-helix transcriptional regulator [Planctomycetaceae bacterium]MDQ3329139.1 metalloregulator ArsR/SmtB family transcription factor [Planctomycetota bacterium]
MGDAKRAIGKCPPPRTDVGLWPDGGAAADEELARYAKALAHPARVKVLRILAQQDACISGDIASQFDLAPSTVSQHVKVLKDAGLIRGEVDGPRVCYCVEPNVLRRLKGLVAVL